MSVRKALEFCGDEGGAIAPLYALALFGLIGMAGVGFDYARVMALDTELQNAADQAALAAASQLDGGTDSITRAQGAVRNFLAKSDGAYVNETRLSNIDDDADGNSRPIAQIQFAFWEDYANDAPDKPVALDVTDSSKAEVVQVTIEQRALSYALTPIVGAIVGRAGATAMATVDSAYCKVPPMMVCVPNSGFGAYDPATGTVSNKGEGVRLHLLPSAGSTDPLSPGVFGFLDFPYPGPSGNPNTTLGWNVTNPGCTGESVETEPGARDTEGEALNTRFDLYRASAPACNSTTGNFCPSKNVTKDVFIENSIPGNFLTKAAAVSAAAAATCGAAGNNPSWVEYDSISRTNPNLDVSALSNPGYPRDTCHIGGSCSTQTFGDGVWDIAAYLRTTHPSVVGAGGAITYPAGLSANSTRHEVYNWESVDGNADGVPDNVSSPVKAGYTIQTANNGRFTAKYYCAYPRPVSGTGIAPPQTLKDRRVLSVAAVDCTGLNGRDTADIIRYIDMFLVKPSAQGGNKEFYAEVIGEEVGVGAGANNFQFYTKRKAVLIR
ncbi:pilus assembly protein TadG-related protein [Croceicoccus ponticola]|nr:pilus assembly protein TadG-related protein [Croceicoccus ponticola]